MYQKRILSLILVFSLLITCCFLIPHNQANATSSKEIKGIDVSSYQEFVDFNKVAAAKIKIVYIRVCMGGDEVDSYFKENYTRAKAAGLKIGFYHYVTAASESEAYDQARYFYSLIKNKTYECRPAMDFESFGDLTDSEINRIATIYLQTLAQLTGTKPVIYSDEYRVTELWEKSLNEYPLWIADYSTSTPRDLGHWSHWAGFQYDDTGTVNGISDHVDLDTFHQSIYVSTTSTEVKNTVKVKSGDTLSKIARKYQTKVSKLAKENLLENPDRILIGQTLILPDESTRHLTYKVKQGDTLWSLSQSFHTDVTTLAAFNELLDPDLILINQILLVPVTE